MPHVYTRISTALSPIPSCFPSSHAPRAGALGLSCGNAVASRQPIEGSSVVVMDRRLGSAGRWLGRWLGSRSKGELNSWDYTCEVNERRETSSVRTSDDYTLDILIKRSHEQACKMSWNTKKRSPGRSMVEGCETDLGCFSFELQPFLFEYLLEADLISP